MHPPPFNTYSHRLSDWPECTLEIRCLSCGYSAHPPLRMLIREHGDALFRELLPRLRCSRCRKPPAPVYLVAGHHRTFCGGPTPDWSLELIPKPR